MKKLLSLFFALSCFAVFVGCKKDKLEDLTVPRLMLETGGGSYGAPGGTTVTLPVSGTSISIQANPLISEFEILNVEQVKVEMGLALLVQTTGQGARKLYRNSVANMGKRIVLMVNGNAIGARRIDGPLQDGRFYTFVEIDDAELGQLVLDLKESLVTIQEELHK